ncbi:MAG: energy transducer TonB [Rhodanobacter sp.]|jgi:hypothetical protein|nr:energy transducer TonB [Rhodanobacter sp.]
MLRRIAAVIVLTSAASAFAQSDALPRVVAPEKLSQHWVMIPSSIEADAPNYGKNILDPGCAAVSFVVEKDGSTSTVKVQRVVPEGDLSKVAASAAAHMRFEPSVANRGRDRVFSWLIFPFNLPADPAQRSAVMQKCQIDKLGWKDR